jgi:hypothetical protein
MLSLVYKEGWNLNFAISAEVIEAVVRTVLFQTTVAPSVVPHSTPSATKGTPLTDAGYSVRRRSAREEHIFLHKPYSQLPLHSRRFPLNHCVQINFCLR